MARYQAFDPNVEVTGGSAMSFIVNMMHDRIDYILKRHALDHIDPQKWYPLQHVLDMLSEVAIMSDSTNIFVSIGMATADLGAGRLPPEIQNGTFLDFMRQYPEISKNRHRGGDWGYMNVEIPNSNHVIVHCRTPYPDDLNYGIIYGYTRYFLTKAGKGFSVTFDETLPTREDGGTETVFHITIDE